MILIEFMERNFKIQIIRIHFKDQNLINFKFLTITSKMHNSQINKENYSQASNSRTIKTFMITREQAKGSRSGEKKRGISRVLAMTKEHAQPTIIISKPVETHVQQQKIQIQRPSVHYSTMQFDQHKINSEKPQFIMPKPSVPKELLQRMRIMEQQQVVMEKQIMELEGKNREWEGRYSHLAQQLRNQIKSKEHLQTQLMKMNNKQHNQNFNSYNNNEKISKLEQMLREKDAVIMQLGGQNKDMVMKQEQSSKVIQQNRSTIHYLQSLVKSTRQENTKYIQQINNLRRNNYKSVEAQKHIQQIRQLQEDNSKLVEQIRDKSAHNQILKRQLNTVQQKYNQITISNTKINDNSNREQIMSLKLQIQEISKDKLQVHEKYRQLMIKTSTLDQQKKAYNYHISQINQELQYYKEDNAKSNNIIKELQLTLHQQMKDIHYYKEQSHKLQQYQAIESKYSMLEEKNREYKDMVTSLQNKRSKQIQYHHEEIKRIKNEHTSYEGKKYEELDKVKVEKTKVEKELQLMKLHSMEQVNKLKINNENIIRDMSRDYQKIISELKDSISHRQSQIQEIQNRYRVQIGILQKEKNGLVLQVDRIRQDNENIITKYENRYRSRSRERSKEINAIAYNNNNIVNSSNKQEYEMQIMDLQDKYKRVCINNEQYKVHNDELQRKIKHYSQQIGYYKEQTEKLIKHKLQYAQETRTLKSQLHSRENTIQKLNHNLSQQQQEHKNMEGNLNNTVLQVQKCHSIIKQLQQGRIQLKQQIIKIYQENQILAQRVSSHIKTTQIYKEDIRQKEEIINKHKQCIQLLKKQNNLIINNNNNNNSGNNNSHQHQHNYGQRHAIYQEIGKVIGLSCHKQQIQFLKKWYTKSYEQTRTIEEHGRQCRDYEMTIFQMGKRMEQPELSLKCRQYERLLVNMQQSHKLRLQEVKKDYDVVYSKYLKYRNMSIALQNSHK